MQVGAVGLPDLSDAVCQDQQHQLAVLASAAPDAAPIAAPVLAAATPAAAQAPAAAPLPAPAAAAAPVAAATVVLVRERRQAVCHQQPRTRGAAQLAALLAGAQQALPLGRTGLAANLNLMALPQPSAAHLPYDAILAATVTGSDVSSHLTDDMRRLWAAI